MQGTIKSSWRGSEKTAEIVRGQIKERYGDEEAEKYDPSTNCQTYNQWKENGYQVKKGEQALKSIIFGETKDDEGNTIKRYPITVNLFYIKQVEKI